MGPPGGPIFGTVFRFIFEVCCIKVAEAQRFGFNEALWLMPAGRATVLNSHFVWRLGFEVLYHCYWWQCCDGGVGLRPRSFFGFGAFLFSSFGAWVDTPLLAWGSALLPTPLFCFVLFICHLTLYSPVFVEIWDYPRFFHSLSHFQDRAFEHNRPHSRKKNHAGTSTIVLYSFESP